jgi:hypothetical protein
MTDVREKNLENKKWFGYLYICLKYLDIWTKYLNKWTKFLDKWIEYLNRKFITSYELYGKSQCTEKYIENFSENERLGIKRFS